MTRAKQRRRKTKKNLRSGNFQSEQLEARQLMAADAFAYEVADRPVDQATMRPANVATVQAGESLKLDLLVPDTTIADRDQSDSLATLDGTTPSGLPEHLEQLRGELGDQAFAEWVSMNAEQTGNLQGFPQDVLQVWARESPQQLRQFEQVEVRLDGWLRDFESNHATEAVAPLQAELLNGDMDGNGSVDFSDFLAFSRNFGREVDAALGTGDFDFNGIVDFADFLEVSRNFGHAVEICGVKGDADDAPEDGEVIQEGGDIEIREGSRVFISDGVSDDMNYDDLMREDTPDDTPISEDMSSWQDIIDEIKDLPDGSITGDLVIVGHGADGGVGASGSDIDGENLTDEQAEILKQKLGPDARIVVIGCDQADEEDNDNMQRLADMTGVPVVGNQDGVHSGTEGDGDWYRFDPSA